VSALSFDPEAEWLESDGLGGYASGTVSGIRTRRYHALLLCATQPPASRVALVNGVEAWVTTASGRAAISAQRYVPDVVYPDGNRRILDFTIVPWPTWTFDAGDGNRVVQEILVDRAACATVLRWRRVAGQGPCTIEVRPLLSGRDHHALHHENPAFDFASCTIGGNVVWRPYGGLPAITALTNAVWRADAEWFRNFLYVVEEQRGMDVVEDLASPGVFAWDLAREEAVMVLRMGDAPYARALPSAAAMMQAEAARRAAFPTQLARAGDAYLVDRGAGRTIIAGFPWFQDWGRDTFIAMRGLTLCTGRLDDAEAILAAWSGVVSEGMLPNRFADSGDTPLYNSVDASLWFVVAVHDFLAAAESAGRSVSNDVRETLWRAVVAILDGYRAGTRYGIRADDDMLITAGEWGSQLTWMDAKQVDWVVTPRVGKAVEVQALWINALRIASARDSRFAAMAEAATVSFRARFPDSRTGGLFDVVDADHERGKDDHRVRPNQIYAVGGLPFPIMEGDTARGIVDLVERVLLTPMGLRSLSPDDPDYSPHYRGTPLQRDSAYHRGTVWPFLLGPFIEAWLRVHGDNDAPRAEARRRFVDPLLASMNTYGLGHICEVADGDPPHTPGGCPFQAWSVGEMLRIEHLLSEPRP
jgi:predicted glycogen debranching enzyme